MPLQSWSSLTWSLFCSGMFMSGCSARPPPRQAVIPEPPVYHSKLPPIPRAVGRATEPNCGSIDSTGLSEARKNELFEEFERSQGRGGTDEPEPSSLASNKSARRLPCQARSE
jgi:hypothetical protein